MRLSLLIAVALGAAGCAGELYTAGYGYGAYPYFDTYSGYGYGYYGPTATVAVSPYVYNSPAYGPYHHGHHRDGHHGHHGHSHGGHHGHSHGGHHHR